ncbi:hypothetical protein IscW_ISCW009516 [Ixodes scapularis]|uniref:Uncharacterized protein n=1 Tax=Ixodes scapularis TaxID=6945 RepID=B7PXT3_IXOSC|nr:hypothetical protein IscW_ISCW009516 [Ixodes scapularis]|eukprot:XP_002401750.1 hypothetical protein IscW_ISCW009516 [Ixodes scapularis]
MSDASGEAVILSGRQIAKEIREKLAVDVKEIKAKHPEFKPLLTIVQVRIWYLEVWCLKEP